MISIVIPTRNRADFLQAAINSIYEFYPPASYFEIIVVDNCSTDDTKETVAKLKKIYNNLAYQYVSSPGLHFARHHGIQASMGDVLAFIDDDVEITETWLSGIINSFKSPDVGLVGGNNLPRFLAPPPQWLLDLWNRPGLTRGKALPSLSLLELPGATRPITPFKVWGCNFSVRKRVLQESQGFHPDGMPSDLIHLRGDGEDHVARHVTNSDWRCIFNPDASIYHKVPAERMTYSYFRQRGFTQGISDSYYTLRISNSLEKYKTTKAYTSRAKGKLKEFARRAFDTATMLSKDCKRALQELKAGHVEGYQFHQKKYRQDTRLREWVHRTNYLEKGLDYD